MKIMIMLGDLPRTCPMPYNGGYNYNRQVVGLILEYTVNM